jgi:hypothetical protein
MHLEPSTIRNIVRARHPDPLAARDAETILALCQLAVDADGREDPDEIAMFFAFGAALYELAGIAGRPTPTASDLEDDQQLRALAAQLTAPASRELAYAIAHVLTVADTAPEESQFLDQLRTALGLAPDHAAKLAADAATAMPR